MNKTLNIEEEAIEKIKEIYTRVVYESINGVMYSDPNDQELNNTFSELQGLITRGWVLTINFTELLKEIKLYNEKITMLNANTAINQTMGAMNNEGEAEKQPAEVQQAKPEAPKESTPIVPQVAPQTVENPIPTVPIVPAVEPSKQSEITEPSVNLPLPTSIETISKAAEQAPKVETPMKEASVNIDSSEPIIPVPVFTPTESAVEPQKTDTPNILPLIPPVENNGGINQPVTPAQVTAVSVPTEVKALEIYQKLTEKPAKAILVGTSQYEKLKNSLKAQRQLLSTTSKAKSSEEIMQAVQQLYAEGKIKEAEQMMSQLQTQKQLVK